jgi:hypothetical protein
LDAPSASTCAAAHTPYSRTSWLRQVRTTGPCCGASAYAIIAPPPPPATGARAPLPFPLPLAAPALGLPFFVSVAAPALPGLAAPPALAGPRLRSVSAHSVPRLARNLAGRANAPRGAAVSGSLSSAAEACFATGASMQSK